MANIKLYDYNEWDYLTLESSSEETNYPDTYTQHRWRGRCWRATGCTSEYVRSAGASSIEISAAFVLNGNISASGTVTLKGSDDNWSSTPTSETMTRSTDGSLYVFIFSSPVTRDDWGVYVADATNTDGYISIGRVWLSSEYEPDLGLDPDSKFEDIDPSTELESTAGQVSRLERPQYKAGSWIFPCIKNKTRYDLLISRVKNGKEFFILKKPKGYVGNDYPDPEDNSYYIRIRKHSENPVAGNYWSANWNVQEER